VGGSRVRERAWVAARALRVPHTNSLTPTPSHTRAPTRVPAIGDGQHAITRQALSRRPRHPKRKGRILSRIRPFFTIPAWAGMVYLCTSAMAAIVPGPWQVMHNSFLALAKRRVS
jgi:hypothetical protein